MLHAAIRDEVTRPRGTQGTEACGGALVLGSHYDTVLDAGKFDGALGIVTAISAVKAFLRDLQALPRCPVCSPLSPRLPSARSPHSAGLQVEIVAFSDEEGVRFHSTFLGSRVFSGSLSPDVLRAQDGDGITVAQVTAPRTQPHAPLTPRAVPGAALQRRRFQRAAGGCHSRRCGRAGGGAGVRGGAH